VDTIGITTRVIARTMTFPLHFKDGGRKRLVGFFLCILFYQIYCVIFSYIQFTFPQTPKYFISNGTKNMHILASGPELQAVRFGYVILGENWTKGCFLNIKNKFLFTMTAYPGQTRTTLGQLCAALWASSTEMQTAVPLRSPIKRELTTIYMCVTWVWIPLLIE
jgi:hypothetical protein